MERHWPNSHHNCHCYHCLNHQQQYNSSNSQASTPTNTTTQTTQSQPAQPPSTLDLLWQALDNSGQSRDGVSITFQDASSMTPGYGSLVTFKKNYGETITHKIFIEDFLKGFVKYGQQAFKVPGVDHLDFEYDTQFTDNHGNVTTDDGMEFKISKDNFNSFNWENLAGTTPYNAIVTASEYDYLAYSIRSDTDPGQAVLILDY